MGDLSEHFSSAEFVDHTTGELVLDPKLIPALEQLRTLADAPITVHDGYRSPAHNAAVGGVSGSQHLLGAAADIVIQGKSLREMYDLAMQVPDFANGGIGLYDGGFIHVDVRGTPARWSRVNGEYKSIDELL